MSNDLMSLIPTKDLMEYAKMLANSSLVPKEFKNKPGDVLIAMQMGAEVGIKPLQALQSIAVINGKPTIWGDAIVGILQQHPAFEDIEETIVNNVATCTIKRRGRTPTVRTFSEEDARQAGLWKKPGPWTQHPKRMLQLRARAFAARDSFSDALKGFAVREEVEDYDMKTVSPASATYTNKSDSILAKLNNVPASKEHEEPELQEVGEESAYSTEEQSAQEYTGEETIPLSLVEQLSALIIEHSVPHNLIDKWLHAAKVDRIDDMEEDQLRKCISYIEEKYNS